MLVPTAERVSTARPQNATNRRGWLAAAGLLMLLVVLWSLRGATATDVLDTDAARHAMNGVFLKDLAGSGHLTDPIGFAKQYYGRLPALSMPYHPPMFPAIESLFFWAFGVHVWVARLVVALATGLSMVLLFALVRATHGSNAIASFTVITFWAWRFSQAVAGDVMLEFPALAFTLGALYLIRNCDTEYELGRAFGFAILAAAAVWTKQHAVFLGAVPFFMIVFARRWRMLANKGLWISSFVYAAAVGVLVALSMQFKGAGANQVSPTDEVGSIFWHNLWFYAATLRTTLGLWPALVLGACVLSLFFVRGEGKLRLYVAWALSAVLVLLLIGPYDARYLFFAYPALIVLAYTAVTRICGLVFAGRARWAAPAALALGCLAIGLRTPATMLRGPGEAAAEIVNGKPQRVLYCGSADGNFVLGVRIADPQLQTTVVSGEKLPESVLQPAAFEQFARRYGIAHVVIERTGRAQVCDALRASPAPSMVLEREIPMRSSLPRWDGGSLSVYRFLNPSPTPDDTLMIAVPKIGADVDVKF